MKSTASKIALGMLAGGAVAAIGSTMMSPSLKKQTRKNAMKAMKTFGSVMDCVLDFMK